MENKTKVITHIKEIQSPNQLLIILLAILLFAQVPVSFLAFGINLPNRPLMLLTRGLILAISIFILNKNRNINVNQWVILISSFWSIYIIRLMYDINHLNVSLAIPTWELFAWSIGVSFLPSLAIYSLASSTKYTLDPSPLIFWGILALGASVIVFAINFNPTESRFLLPDLNPIPAGHAGTSLFIVSLSSIFLQKGYQSIFSYPWLRGLSLLGTFIGLYITLSSSTRSAFISLILALILILIVHNRSGSIRRRILNMILLFSSILVSYLLFSKSGLSYKLQTIGQGESELNRLAFASSGLSSWLEKPLLGQGFEMHSLLQSLFPSLNHYYPHNFIIESLLIGGLLLGGIMVSFIILTTLTSINLINLSKNDVWIVCLWLQGLVYVMFSGHLGNVPLFWFSSAAIFGRYQALISRNTPIK